MIEILFLVLVVLIVFGAVAGLISLFSFLWPLLLILFAASVLFDGVLWLLIPLGLLYSWWWSATLIFTPHPPAEIVLGWTIFLFCSGVVVYWVILGIHTMLERGEG